MKYKIYLLSYNNYNNRQVKKLNSISDYVNAGYVLSSFETANFEYRDGISSGLIVNKRFVSQEPDYILVEDIETRVVDNSTNPATVSEGQFSRWFIIDSDLIRGNQYQFTIRRDIWVDHYDLAMNSIYFVERGYVLPSNDLIFNNEEQKFSQIKKEQTPLYDETGCPWIVGFIPRNSGSEGALADNKTIATNVYTADADLVVTSLSNWEYNNYTNVWTYADNLTENPYQATYKFPVQNNVNGNTLKYQRVGIGLNFKNHTLTDAFLEVGATQYDTGVYGITKYKSQYDMLKVSTQFWYESTPRTDSAISLIDKAIAQQVVLNSYNHYDRTLTYFRYLYNPNNGMYSQLQSFNGKTIKDTTANKVYRISVITENYSSAYQYTSGDTNMEHIIDDLIDYLPSSIITSYGSTESHRTLQTVYTDDFINIDVDLMRCKISLVEIANVQTTVPKDDSSGTVYRTHLVDAPYDMFAIPYGPLVVKEGISTYTCNKDVGLAMAQAFVTELGAELVYDLQIMPYCPVRQYIKSDDSFDITDANQTQVRPITLGGGTVNYVFYCSQSQFEITALHAKEKQPYSIALEADVKKQYNTTMYRLCSPNWASMFEFNPAMNGGVNCFQITATYKPFNPYVRIHPRWGRMYGDPEIYDARGLILSGDFSLTRVTDAWREYELNNKNYLRTFNREIQSLELQNSISQAQDWFKGISGIVSGTVGGAIAGQYAGSGSPGTGALIGSTLSAVGGALDISSNITLRNDAIAKAQTLFQYQMDNIKALPNTLANVGCFTFDNVLVPILEFYQASPDEIDAFEKKMQYYGMSVMKVGQVVDYLNPLQETFVQGYLLRLLSPEGVNTEADNHLAEELSKEFQKGLYIGG